MITDKLGSYAAAKRLITDQIVFSQGDPADAVFYIQKGKVKITVISEQGKEAVVAILGANDFFGEGCLAGQARRIATAVTMTDSVVVTAGKSRHSPRDPSGTSVPRDVHCRSSGTDNPRRSNLVDQLFNSSDNRASFATTATSKSTVHC